MWTRYLTRVLLIGMIWSLCVVCGTASVPTPSPSSSSQTQHVVLVYERACLDSVTLTDRARVEVPVDADGRPVIAQARIDGILVTYKADCGRYEVRK